MSKLTAKQDKFARLVAEGKTQADAYREAYNALKMADKTVWERASFEASKDKVKTRIDELKKEFTKKLDIVSTITVERQIKYTQKVIQECLKTGDFNNSLKAMDMQNRLIGLYAPTKTDNKTTVEFTEKEAINSLKEKLKALDE
jgi:hypothetical protein